MKKLRIEELPSLIPLIELTIDYNVQVTKTQWVLGLMDNLVESETCVDRLTAIEYISNYIELTDKYKNILIRGDINNKNSINGELEPLAVAEASKLLRLYEIIKKKHPNALG